MESANIALDIVMKDTMWNISENQDSSAIVRCLDISFVKGKCSSLRIVFCLTLILLSSWSSSSAHDVILIFAFSVLMILNIEHILKSMIGLTLKGCSNLRAIYWISSNRSNLLCLLIQVQVGWGKRKNYYRVHMIKTMVIHIMISAVILNANAMIVLIIESPEWDNSSSDTSKLSPNKV